MLFTENALNILTTKVFKWIGKAWIIKNLRWNEEVETIVSLLNSESKNIYPISIYDFERIKLSIKEKIKLLDWFVDGIVAIWDKNFPHYRWNVKNSEQPVFLFYRGNLNLLNTTNANIAVIGLLNPDKNIEIIEKKVVAELIKNDITIISWLALGCDTIAHIEALNLKWKTIAILPSSLNKILPSKNQEIANQIVRQNGLLITEYYEEYRSQMELSSRYQERDRLQALFSDGIILSASYAKNNQWKDSGSRLAMWYALNYWIPRAVIYNEELNKYDEMYDLNRQIIWEDANVIIINENNLSESIKNLLSKKNNITKNNTIQFNLFDF
jgi:DNA processing protein